jgi:hypothetical protein
VLASLGRFPFSSLHIHVRRSFLFILFGFSRRPFLFLPSAFDDLVMGVILVLVIVFSIDVVSVDDTGSS